MNVKKKKKSRVSIQMEGINDKAHSNTLVVDKHKGPYKTIQSAIDDAVPSSIIKIESGLYKENLVIKVPNLFIEPLTELSEIYLVASNGPAIFVEISKKKALNIQGLNISNKGHYRVQKRQFEDESTLETNYHKQLYSHLEVLMKTESFVECENLIYLKKGSLFINNCKLSLNLFYKTSTDYVSSIYMLKKSKCVVNDCQFIGSKLFLTNAITVNNADLSIRNSVIKNHMGIGIMLKLSPINICSIYMCSILDNNIGVFSGGENYKSKITECSILNNTIGLFICLGNEILIYKSKVKNNVNGIYVTNADAYIEENDIELNFKNGVKVLSTQGILSRPRIKDNNICYNMKSGIKCKGENNLTIIKNNNIFKNKEKGISCLKKSNVLIFNNTVKNNMGIGISIGESSSAFVEKNEIEGNIKANLAVGGTSNEDTVILNNKIFKSRCEGIFLLQSYKIRIMKNQIYDNQLGILSINSSPICFNNTIKDNKSHGLLCIKKSNIVINQNDILDNRKVGLFLRDYFMLEASENEIKNNKIGLIVEKRRYSHLDLAEGNDMQDEVRHPKHSICCIF